MHTTMHMTLLSVPLQLALAWERVLRGVCAVSSDKRPRARRASRALRRACGQGAELSLCGVPCVVWLGLGRFGVGFLRLAIFTIFRERYCLPLDHPKRYGRRGKKMD